MRPARNVPSAGRIRSPAIDLTLIDSWPGKRLTAQWARKINTQDSRGPEGLLLLVRRSSGCCELPGRVAEGMISRPNGPRNQNPGFTLGEAFPLTLTLKGQ